VQETLTRADLREAMRNLEENNGKQSKLPERLTQAFVQGSGYWGWLYSGWRTEAVQPRMQL